jgi:hypothetical protein
VGRVDGRAPGSRSSASVSLLQGHADADASRAAGVSSSAARTSSQRMPSGSTGTGMMVSDSGPVGHGGGGMTPGGGGALAARAAVGSSSCSYEEEGGAGVLLRLLSAALLMASATAREAAAMHLPVRTGAGAAGGACCCVLGSSCSGGGDRGGAAAAVVRARGGGDGVSGSRHARGSRCCCCGGGCGCGCCFSVARAGAVSVAGREAGGVQGKEAWLLAGSSTTMGGGRGAVGADDGRQPGQPTISPSLKGIVVLSAAQHAPSSDDIRSGGGGLLWFGGFWRGGTRDEDRDGDTRARVPGGVMRARERDSARNGSATAGYFSASFGLDAPWRLLLSLPLPARGVLDGSHAFFGPFRAARTVVILRWPGGASNNDV